MADNDPRLRITIEGDATSTVEAGQQAASAIDSVKQETKDLCQSLPEGSEVWGKYKNILDETSGATAGFNLRTHETRILAAELNRILPGLGLAFRGLTAAMGPFIVVALAIQAATTWWKLYKDEVEAAAKAHADALDKMREATRAAVEEDSKFAEQMNQSKTAAAELDEELGRRNTLLDAAAKAQKKVLDANKEAELAAARTPGERKAVEEKYAGLYDEAENQQRRNKLEALNDTIKEMQEKELKLNDELAWNKEMRNIDLKDKQYGEAGEYKKKIDQEEAELKALKTSREQLQGKVATETSVGAIEEFAQSDVANIKRRSREYQSARAIADRLAGGGAVGAVDSLEALTHGQTLSATQIEFNRDLSTLLDLIHGNIGTLLAIVRYHQVKHTTTAQEIQAVQNYLGTLESQLANVSQNSFHQ